MQTLRCEIPGYWYRIPAMEVRVHNSTRAETNFEIQLIECMRTSSAFAQGRLFEDVLISNLVFFLLKIVVSF